MPNDPKHDAKPLVEYDNLNTAGKAVFIAGTAYKMAERVVDYTFTTLGTIWEETEKAFQAGLEEGDSSRPSPTDLNDAVILEESKD